MGGSDGGFPKVPERSEDNFGKPLDALDGLPPEGTRKSRVRARSERARLQIRASVSGPILTRKGILAGGSVAAVKRAGRNPVRCAYARAMRDRKCDSAAAREERSGFAALQCRIPP
jgi:hypothetical protein